MNRKNLDNLSLLELSQYYQEKQKNFSSINSTLAFQGYPSYSRRAGYSRSTVRLPPIQRNSSEMKEFGETALRRTPGKIQCYSHTDQCVPEPSPVSGRPMVPHRSKRRENQDYNRDNISDPVGRSASDKEKSSEPPSCRRKGITGNHKKKYANEQPQRGQFYEERGKVQNQTRQMQQNQFAKCGPSSILRASNTPTTGLRARDTCRQVFLSPSQQMERYQTDGFQFRGNAGGRPTIRPSTMVCFQNGGREQGVPRRRVRREGLCEVTDAAHGNRTFIRVLSKRF